MRAGGTKNPAVQVFGFGNWVMDQTDSLQKWEEEFRFKLVSSLLLLIRSLIVMRGRNLTDNQG